MKHVILSVALGLPALAQAQEPLRPTAWTEAVQPLDAVDRISMPPVVFLAVTFGLGLYGL